MVMIKYNFFDRFFSYIFVIKLPVFLILAFLLPRQMISDT